MEVSSQEEDHQQQRGQQMIQKGKRTKRQRPQSPIPFPIITDVTCREGGDYGDENYSTTAISTSPDTSVSREEEEDMANCLILLAQGHSKEENIIVPFQKIESSLRREKKAGGGGLAYGYECKTCNRTFPSFQALGGHRASHKKLKPIAMVDDRKQIVLSSSSDEEDSNLFHKKIMVSSLSLQLGSYKATNNNSTTTGNKSRSHECSICGAEFTSGQALGGHMRRHRGSILAGTVTAAAADATATTANTALSLSPIPMGVEEVDNKPRINNNNNNNNNGFCLDLNLPAPEDEHKENKFAFASKQPQQQQQQAALVLSSNALVDCHY